MDISDRERRCSLHSCFLLTDFSKESPEHCFLMLLHSTAYYLPLSMPLPLCTLRTQAISSLYITKFSSPDIIQHAMRHLLLSPFYKRWNWNSTTDTGDELELKADLDPPDTKALLSTTVLSLDFTDDSPSLSWCTCYEIGYIDFIKILKLTVVEPTRNLFLSHVII